VIARTVEIDAWIQPFESSSENPFSVIAIVASWPDGDTQTFPRLISAYWPQPGVSGLQGMKEDARELLDRFAEAPMESLIRQGVDYWELAHKALFLDPMD